MYEKMKQHGIEEEMEYLQEMKLNFSQHLKCSADIVVFSRWAKKKFNSNVIKFGLRPAVSKRGGKRAMKKFEISFSKKVF